MTGEQVILGGIFAGILILLWIEIREMNNREAIRRATKNLKDKTKELKDVTDSMGEE